MCFFNFKRLSLFFAKMLIVNLRFNFMRSRKFLLISSLIASLAVFSSGCAYRADLAQGNPNAQVLGTSAMGDAIVAALQAQ